MGLVFSHDPFGNNLRPNVREEPTFDSLMGFPNGRKERVMIATEEELKSAKIPLEDRDYCAHLLLKYRACRRDQFPFLYRCGHEKHEYEYCEHEDFILRMKEYEREKRLLARAAKKRAKEEKEMMNEE
ncbi:NADH dehydrogenase [ubiquinone] 1 beta subcomplex subunit 7-like [Centruroides sculpturatus]|uniref:NADH dehydrogenase [ubiquinone] 1 beta subcomplex subunit 7-like n=1 Tax=Centruroides sculpturatus TaxID=218467 RepID=UPI000C6D41C8|nr:NADH dehydrogenase [ubiquinone] 1 beta subcomplex subunit 7-like [Centruroides sculpturatus]